jgi:zinc-ribbon family
MQFIFGKKQTTIDFDEILMKCPSCEVHTNTEIMVVSYYFHFFRIPFFPLSKEAHIVCSKCNMRRYNLPFDEDLFSTYKELNPRFRHPWFTYTGTAIILIITVSLFIAVG